MDEAAEEMGLQAAELQQAMSSQVLSEDQTPLSGKLHSALQPWLRQKALDVLPRRLPFSSPQPALEAPEEAPESSKQDGGSLALKLAPQQQRVAEQQVGSDAALGSEQDAQLDQSAQLAQSAEGTAAAQASGQSRDELQRAELLDAGVASDRPAAAGNQQQSSLQAVADLPQAPAEALDPRDQPTLLLAPAGEADRAEPSQPGVRDSLQGAGHRAPSEPTQDNSAAVETDAPSDVNSESVPAATKPASKQQASELADVQASLAGPALEQQPAGTGQLALQAGDEAPASSAPTEPASTPAKQRPEPSEGAFSCLPCTVTSMTPDQAAKLGTWASWQDALRAAPAAAQAAAADDEALHPYTRRLLSCPPSQYVLQPERLDENRQVISVVPSATDKRSNTMPAQVSNAGMLSSCEPAQECAHHPFLAQLS